MKRMLKVYILAFVFASVVVINFCGLTYADNVEIKLGSGDGFKVLNSGGSPLMDILSNGDVGIGTSPNYELDVSGDINFTGSLYQNGSIYGGSSVWSTSNSDIYFDSGKVGIGTTNPNTKLEVAGNIAISGLDDTMATSYEQIRQSSVGDLVLDARGGLIFNIDTNNNGSNDFSIRSDGSSADIVTIKDTGNVGIGTTGPDEKLEVSGGLIEANHGAPTYKDYQTQIGTISPIGFAAISFQAHMRAGTNQLSNSLAQRGVVVYNESGNLTFASNRTSAAQGALFDTSNTHKNMVIKGDTGNVSIGGKLTVTGGIDPPYISFSDETHKSIRGFANDVEEHEKVMQFWNSKAHRMEVYVIDEDKFYTITGKLIE